VIFRQDAGSTLVRIKAAQTARSFVVAGGSIYRHSPSVLRYCIVNRVAMMKHIAGTSHGWIGRVFFSKPGSSRPTSILEPGISQKTA